MSIHIRSFDWDRALRKGEEMALEQAKRGSTPDASDVMWALFVDAVETTGRAYKGPPFTGWPTQSSMPEPDKEFSIWAQISAYLKGELDEMPETESRPPQPSAEQISRAEIIMRVWHEHALAAKGNWSALRKAVYSRAAGMPYKKITVVSGLTRRQIQHARDCAMQDMVEAIDQLCYR